MSQPCNISKGPEYRAPRPQVPTTPRVGRRWIEGSVCALAIVGAFVSIVTAPSLKAFGLEEETTKNNLHQLAASLRIYATDFDGTLPPSMGSNADLALTMRPYVVTPTVLGSGHPNGGLLEGNAALAGAVLDRLENADQVPLVIDTNYWSGGTMVIADAGGEVRSVPHDRVERALSQRSSLDGEPLAFGGFPGEAVVRQ